MKVFVLVVLSVVFLGSLGEYVGGRIILPAVGLTAPGYWTWFWFMFWGMVFGIPLYFVKALFD